MVRQNEALGERHARLRPLWLVCEVERGVKWAASVPREAAASRARRQSLRRARPQHAPFARPRLPPPHFDTPLGCESVRDDIQVRAVVAIRSSHGEPVRTRDISTRRETGRPTPRTRRHLHASFTHSQKLIPIFNVSSQYSLLLLREIAGSLQQELQGYANEFWTLLYQKQPKDHSQFQ